jgi:hypothetical protein
LGNPFISTSLFIWEAVSEDDQLFSATKFFIHIFLCWKTVESDLLSVCVLSIDVWEQAPWCKTCSTGAAGPPEGGSSAAAVATAIPDDSWADVPDSDSGSPSDWSDLSSNAAGAATATPTSTPSASLDASGAQRQAGRIHEEPSPVFAHSADPMDAEDWLCTVQHELHTAQCNDREKVLYGPRLLRGATQSWWEYYLATHADPEAITWEEFTDNFYRYHVPEGLMIVRKEEFLALKQGPMSISEYKDKFL